MKAGDKVTALDEDLEGVVLRVDGDTVYIDSDGFEMEFEKHQLVVIGEEDIENHLFQDQSLKAVIREKEGNQKKRRDPIFRQKDRPPMEVDLHAHQLTGSTKNMTKHEILNLQLSTAKHKIEFAIKKNIQRIVFIHGVGEGVLKMELETLFCRYDNLKYYDADYKKYGFGATEVYLYQNIPS